MDPARDHVVVQVGVAATALSICNANARIIATGNMYVFTVVL